MKNIILAIIISMVLSSYAFAAEVKNVVSSQSGNRVLFEYDLTGEEKEADVNITITVNGTAYSAEKLYLEGDYGKVSLGKGRKIYWNVLQDFPRGLNTTFEWEITEGGKDFKDPLTGMEFVFVKGGCFQMGDTFGDGDADAKPVHEVCVDDFYLGKYEVTQRQWREVMGNNPSYFKNCGDDCPVEQVSWNDVQEFINKLNEKITPHSPPLDKGGRKGGYRLPTEAEWEYAVRSCGKKEEYSGSDSIDSVAWYDSNSGRKTHPVGQRSPNGLGIYDMSGNVWEWVQDWYGEKYYGESPKYNPNGPNSGTARVLRGGSWSNITRYALTSNRVRYHPDYRFNNVGYRLLWTK
ncbi:MAG: formylglycine-generating enzyme family protein [Nitrospiraceae bacterium]|nr:MAG: formylglycine-generating enzyme family protein [Nitrospiraceae bacterium]